MTKVVETVQTWICDICLEKTIDQPFRYQGKLRLRHDLHDYQGAAVAGWDKEFDLCPDCLHWLKTVLADRMKSFGQELR